VSTPFLYENSDFYKRRFDRLGLTPNDVKNVDDLIKWPPVDKLEMAEDLLANPPWGTYTTHSDEIWNDRGWSLFPTSGTTGVPRMFRYSKCDLGQWKWANARAMWSFGVRPSETVFWSSDLVPTCGPGAFSTRSRIWGCPASPGRWADGRTPLQHHLALSPDGFSDFAVATVADRASYAGHG